MKGIFKVLVVSGVANQNVVVQNWWPASTVHGTCKLSVSHHQAIRSSPMSWLSKNLSVALLKHYAFLTQDAFYDVSIFIFFFVTKSTVRQLSMHYQFAKLCRKAATFGVALICDNETTVFYTNDVFEVLSKLNVHVQWVRTIRVGLKTRLKIFFGISVACKRKRGNDGGRRLHFIPRYSWALIGKSWEGSGIPFEIYLTWTQRFVICQAFKTLNSWKSKW